MYINTCICICIIFPQKVVWCRYTYIQKRYITFTQMVVWCGCRIGKYAYVWVGLSPKGLPASRFRDKWQTWDGKRKTCFIPSRIVTFFPVQKSFVPAGPKCDIFREGCDKNRHKLKKIFWCARASHSSQKCDKCDASHFLSPEKVINVTSLTQIWDGKLGRNPGKTDPMCDIPLTWLVFVCDMVSHMRDMVYS